MSFAWVEQILCPIGESLSHPNCWLLLVFSGSFLMCLAGSGWIFRLIFGDLDVQLVLPARRKWPEERSKWVCGFWCFAV
jgi:hypothetical protein